MHWPESWMSISQAESVSGTIGQILKCILSDSNQIISEIDWLSDHDRRLLLQWNGHQMPMSKRTLHSAIDLQTILHSDSEAVCAWDGSLTYQGLDDASENLASLLRSKGVGPGVNVPFCFDKSKYVIVSMLAILKAGGAFVPLDPKNPQARLQSLIAKVDATIVLCAPEYKSLLTGMAKHIIPVDEYCIDALSSISKSVASPAESVDRAYVIFTSGSTGEPKAVIIQHQAIMSSIEAHGRALGFSPKTRSLQFSAFVWDVSICDIFTTLCYGGCVCIPSEHDRINALEKAINSMHVNFACMTPTICKMIDATAVPGLANLLLIGEAMTAPIIEAWSDRILINSYGPAEASVMCHLNFPMKPDKSPMCFGHPVGIRAWIADRHNHNRLMPLGSVGELLLEGPLLSQGYYKDEVKTSESYITNPTWVKQQPMLGNSRRFYKTGDLAKYNPDGSYEFAGRKDTQIKFHGQRIELAEIEFNIQRPPTVKHAVVLLPKAGPCSGHLVAILHLANVDKTDLFPQGRPLTIVNPKENQTIDTQIKQYKEELKAHLPEYMIPAIWTVVEAIPSVSSGKLDRTRISRWVVEMDKDQHKSLQPAVNLDASKHDQIHSASPMEEQMRSIWSTVLDIEVDRISYNRSFLSYSGDSLSSMQVAGICRKHGIKVAVHEVLRSSSIIKLCESAQVSDGDIQSSVDPQINHASDLFSFKKLTPVSSQELEDKLSEIGVQISDIEEVYPCSHVQQGIMLDRTRNAEAYAAHSIYKVNPIGVGMVEVDRLLQAWQIVIDRHALLRTVFIEGLGQHDSIHSQAVLKRYNPTIVPSKFSDERQAIKSLQEQTGNSYDDGRSPLHRLTICITSAGTVLCKLDISHAIMDGASISIMIRDMTMAYSGLLNLEKCPIYSNWLNFMSSYDSKQALDYWKGYLIGAEPCHLPVLVDGSAIQKIPKAIRIDFEEVKQLQYFCDNNGFTMANAFHAAWALTLKSYTSSEDIIFGYISSGRDPVIEDSRDTVGPYINMLSCRLKFDDDLKLEDLLLQAQKDHLAALPYQHIALAEVHNLLQLTETALFNTMLSYRKVPSMHISQAEIKFEEVVPTFDPDIYNVSINIEAHDKTMAIDFGYWTDCLCDEQALNIADTFKQALRTVAYDSNQQIKNLEYLGERQKQQIGSWNDDIPIVLNLCIHDLIHSQSLSRPEKSAIDAWDGVYTYAELDKEVTKLSYQLKRLGVMRETPVMLCFNKSAYAIIGAIAVLKSGGVCVPLDATYPRSAIQVRVNDTGAKYALAGKGCDTAVEGLCDHVIVLDDNFMKSLSTSDQQLDKVDPEDACFIIYTSGSTGNPKGVVLEHRNLTTSSANFAAPFQLNEDSRVLQFASYTFDNSLAEIYTTLMRGGCVCVPSDIDRYDNTGHAMNRFRVTYADITPSVAGLINPADVPTLERLMLGAEAITQKVVDMWKDHVSLGGGYGPSECSINSAYSADITSTGKATNIGKGCGCILWIVDAEDHNKLVPIGAPGELLVEGPIISRGYLNNEQKTSEVFIRNPAWVKYMPLTKSTTETRRMYKTGDLVRYDSDGTIMYLGRKDNQVKFNGQRIELGEIEHQLERCLPEGNLCAVDFVAIGDDPGARKELVAFVCSKKYESIPGARGSSSDLLEFTDDMVSQYKSITSSLSKTIQSYMVPTVWLPMKTIPLSSAGKLNRRQLRTLANSIPASSAKTYRLSGKGGRAPAKSFELQLAELWSSVLNIDISSIGAEDNFFKLGGNSLIAMRLVSAARIKGIQLSVNSVFQNSTLENMASSAQDGTAQKSPTLPDIKPFSLIQNGLDLDNLKADIAQKLDLETNAILDVYPCSPMQAGLISLSAKSPGAYVAHMAYSLPEDINIDRFCQAWQMVNQAESSLRTRIMMIDSHGLFNIVTNDNIDWETADSPEDLPKEAGLLPAKEGDKLVSYAITGEGTSNVQLIVSIHHALYDGWSWPLLLSKVKSVYENNTTTQISRSPKFANFIKYLQNMDVNTSDDFWRTALAGTASAQFPRLPSPSYKANASTTLCSTIQINTSAASEITIASIIRAAWALVVAAYSGNDEVTFHETLGGRDIDVEDIDQMIGATLTTVPTRIRIDRKLTFSKFLQVVQACTVEARPHQYAGLQRIKQLSADAALACDAQSLIAVNHGGDYEDELFRPIDASADNELNFYTYPLMINCFVEPDSISIEAHHDQNIISDWRMNRILQHFEFVLVHLMDQRQSNNKLQDLCIPNPVDQQTIKSWNSTMIPKIDSCIHELISQHCQSDTSNRPALHAWDLSLTYKELDKRSTNLAWRLHELGVRGQSIVPLYFDKSGFTVVAMLAVLKNNASFLLLSPDQPQSRLQYIVENVEAETILCSARHIEFCKRLVSRVIPVGQDTLCELAIKPQLPAITSSSSIAYVIFTSGTTGKPKGTLISHSAFCTSAHAHGSVMGLDENSRTLNFASYTFDASIMEILTTLILKGCVCVPDDDSRLNDITKAINEMKVNWTLLTPSFVQSITPTSVPGLRTLILGGEAPSEAHINTWSSRLTLMNAFGPSESSVVATVNPQVSLKAGPSNIGYPTGCRCWVVDASDHNKLVPLGCVGELLIDGPILAQGYLKDEAKTKAAFISDPAWLKLFDSSPRPSRQMYKTGDLVKYAEDGSVIFIGRKDSQVKINGQRVELGEIEHHLSSDSAVLHSMIILPKTGPFRKKLVAVMSLKAASKYRSDNDSLLLADQSTVASQLITIRQRLAAALPIYMVPAHYMVLESLPLLPSGKIDRKQIAEFVDRADQDLYRQVANLQTSMESLGRDASTMEEQLRDLVANILNLSPKKISYRQSFLGLGGDSLQAMALLSRCRAAGFGLKIQDILSSKTLVELSNTVVQPKAATQVLEENDKEFSLSPIQKVYFDLVDDKWQHFNQSYCCYLKEYIEPDRMKVALEKLIANHPMMRARFIKDASGEWRQKISTNVAKSYELVVHKAVMSTDQIVEKITTSQKSPDVANGPLIIIDIFMHSGTQQQLLSICAHHLVIDIVSWKILTLDLENALRDSNAQIQSEHTSFQRWTQLQSVRAQEENSQAVLAVQDIPIADLSYWGMKDIIDQSGDVLERTFELDPHTTSQLLGDCNRAMDTDLVDVLVASILYSFTKTFPDREDIPALYNEGHGREAWDEIDISQTIGWFTTLTPIHLPSNVKTEDNLIKCIRWVKDIRRRTPAKGRSYFACRQLTESGRSIFAKHWPMEMAFNYLGQMNSSADTNTLLLPIPEDLQLKLPSDIGSEVPRFGLFDISAALHGSRIRFSFSYNKACKFQDKIKNWVMKCQSTLVDAASALSKASKQATMASFPSIPLVWNGIEKVQKILPTLGVSQLTEVEDIYPCSPMQRGMLLSQVKDPLNYSFKSIFKLSSIGQKHNIDVKRLVNAWNIVVQQHSALRTVFVDELSGPGSTAQVVLKHHTPRIVFWEVKDDKVQGTFAEQEAPDYTELIPPHRLTILKTESGTVYCRLDMSHSIIDGASMALLFAELGSAYANNHTGAAALYSDYIKHIQSKSSSFDMDYWKQYLAAIEPCTFPNLTDGKQCERKLQCLELEIPLSSEISSYCVSRQITLSTLLQLTWALVLRIYTGNYDVSFGYLVSGRDAPVEGIEKTIGVFINMLTCRFNLQDDMQVESALQTAQADLSTGMSHQSVPLADIQHAINLGTPIFNTVFSLQKRSSTNHENTGSLSYEFLDSEDPSEFHLTVNIEVTDTNLGVSFTYWANTISSTQVSGISAVFDQILNDLVTSHKGQKKLGEIDYISSFNVKQLNNFNSTPLPRLENCIHTIFSQHARAQPFAAAFDAHDGHYTYAELDVITDSLAKKLISMGVKVGDFVPVSFEKSVFMGISMLAILKAGGAFVPISPDVPESRLEFLLENVKANVVLCSEPLASKMSKKARQTFAVSRHALQNLSQIEGQSLAKVSSHDMAYAIFTSGTTGVPKGTIIEHGAFCTGGTEHARAMFLKKDSRTLQFASYTFDASVMEVLSTLLIGGCVCFPTDQERMSDIPGLIQRMNITWTLLTPSVANILKPETISSLKTLVTGGEAMSRDHIQKWAGTGIALVNAYGPSECSVVATTHTKVNEHGQALDSEPANIGFAVGSRCWVVNPDNHDQLVPTGAIGELLVEGRITARCYLANEEKTNASFITSPAWTTRSDLASIFREQERMYKTGDLVRCNSDGSFNYIGRKDTQIKLNGQRIEVAEIEHHVKSNLPENSQAAVDLVAPPESRKALAVFFSMDSLQPVQNFVDDILLPMATSAVETASAVQLGLKNALPAYMVPTIYIPVTSMPWTASGKLDRGRLKAIITKLSKEDSAAYKIGAGSISTKQLPQTDMEKKLQSYWAEALEIKAETIGSSDNFFRLGGDSISGMKLVNIAAADQVSLATIDVFRNPKLSDMAEMCSILKSTSDNLVEPFILLPDVLAKEEVLEELATICQIPEGQIQDAYPCSRLQEGLLALSIKQSGAYVARYVFKLAQSIKISDFKAAWQRTVDETDILRSRIPHGETFGFMQVVLKQHELDWQTVNHLKETEEQVQIPGENGGSLTRYYMVEDSDSRYFVLLIHHSLYDGWSLPLVLQRIEENYSTITGISKYKDILPPAPYVNFIQFLQEISPETSDDFWINKLADSSWASHYPSSKYVEKEHIQTLQQSHTSVIRKDLNKLGVTLPVVLRAAWALLLSIYTNSSDVLFGETLAARDVPVHRIIDICGPTLTTVPQKIRIDRSLTIQQYLQSVQRLSTDIIPYQHAGLQHIKRLGPDATAACDFQNLLVIQAPQDDESEGILQPEGNEAGSNFFTYPLVLECNIRSGEVNFEAHHNASILDVDQTKRLLSHFDLIIQHFTADMLYKRVADITVFGSQDLDKIRSWKAEANGIWIADPLDINKLAPVGAVGEMLVEEHQLTKEMPRNEIVSDLDWMPSMNFNSANLYKAGHLARYNLDGTVDDLGQKNNQIRLHGQHIDLHEIERLIQQRPQIRQVIAAIPKSGPCSKELIAVVSLTSMPSVSVPCDTLALIENEARLSEASPRLEKAQAQISEEVPLYMIPALWIMVEDIPKATSGALDRETVFNWLEGLDNTTYRQILDNSGGSSAGENQGETVTLLRRIWSEVFGVAPESIRDHDSYISLGGDSISAMTVMAKCRKEGITLSLQDVLRSKSVVSLARKISSRAPVLYSAGNTADVTNESFELSPIQRLYFEFIDPAGCSQFNQSQYVAVNRRVKSDLVRSALHKLVSHHSMLRVRFAKSIDAWSQRITDDVDGSYKFDSISCDQHGAIRKIGLLQGSLDVVNGPLVACTLLEDPISKAQSIFIAVHHLVVDAVSWSPILQDFEALLINDSYDLSAGSISFQAWTQLQSSQAENVSTDEIPKLMPIKARPADLQYWSMVNQRNVYGDTETKTFEIGSDWSSLALGSANSALATEPIDLMITAIAHSFRTTFNDRQLPPIFNESHGREWDASVDFSSTVGWFTTVTPIQLKPKDQDDMVQIARLVKDTRKRIPGNGRPYFAYRNSKSSQTKFSDALPVEILFNYLGRSAPTDKSESLLQNIELPTDEAIQTRVSDVGMSTTRLALFEISAAVTDGKINFSFIFNKKMNHVEKIRNWIECCQETLQDIAQTLSSRAREPTLTDFPLLPMTYEDLPKIMSRSLPKAGIKSLEQVEDIYPCSPTQEGVLLSQLRSPTSYIFHEINEVIPRDDTVVDTSVLIDAWNQVVARHQILRSAFTDSFYKGGNFDQIVLRNPDTGALLLQDIASDDEDAIRILKSTKIQDHNYSRLPRLPHQMSTIHTKGRKVFMKLEMTHAVIDGTSSANILRDIALAYEGKLDPQGPLYSDYIAFIKRQTPTSSIRHFKNYLSGIEPCLFPSLNQTDDRQLNFVMVDFDSFSQLLTICKETNVTLASMMQAAWAILLRSYTKTNDVSFGYLTSGRDSPVNNIQDAVGLFINMLICRVQFDGDAKLSSIFTRVQNDYLEMLPFQHSSLAKVQHELNLDGKTLFNTAVSIQGSAETSKESLQPTAISFEPLAAHDPSEYAVTANIYVKPGDEGCLFRYWTNIISDQQAKELATQMSDILHSIVKNPNQTLNQMKVSITDARKEVQTKRSVVSFKDHVEEVLPDNLRPIKTAASSLSNVSRGSSLSASTIQTPESLHSSMNLQSIIKSAVQEALDQMLKSGKIMFTDGVNSSSPSIVPISLPNSAPISETSSHDIRLAPEEGDVKKVTSKAVFQGPTDDLVKINKTVQKEIDVFAPTTEDHTVKLRLLWSETLELSPDAIELESNFFELDGDSINAMEMAGLARENGISLTVASIFQNPIFKEMAKQIHDLSETVRIEKVTTEYQKGYQKDSSKDYERETISYAPIIDTYLPFSLLDVRDTSTFLHEHVCPKVNIFRGGIQDVLPVTDFQATCIAGTLLDERFTLNYFYLDGHGGLDMRRLRDGVSSIIQLHDVFRMVYISYKDKFYQVMLRTMEPKIDFHETDDIDKFTKQMRENDILNGQPQLGTPFAQFSVIKKADSNDHRIVIRLSHAQYDGISFDKILTHLKQAYEGQPQTSAPSYRSFLNYCLGGNREGQYMYWRDLLSGSTVTELVKRTKPNLNKGDAQSRTISKLAQLPNLASYHITDATIVKAAWALVLARLTCTSDVVFGQLVNGRTANVEGIENIVGPCLNYTPVRVKFEKDFTYLNVLRLVHDQHIASMPCENLGFNELIENCTDWEKWLGFSTMVHHLNIVEHQDWTMGGLPYQVGALGSGCNTDDIEIVSRLRTGGKIDIELSYANDGYIKPEFATKIIDMLCDTIEAMSRPKATIPSWTGPSQVIYADPEPEDTTTLSILNDLDEPRTSAARHVVKEAWSTTSQGQVLDTSNFFDPANENDFVDAAITSLAYQQKGYDIAFATILDHPSMKHHMALIASQQKHEADSGSETSTLNEPDPEDKRPSGWKKKFSDIFGSFKKTRSGRRAATGGH